MPLDSRGIHQFIEADTSPTFSGLLNKLAGSVSTATKSFSGTPAQRAALDPAPEGARWRDTDAARREWVGVGGVWVIDETSLLAYLKIAYRNVAFARRDGNTTYIAIAAPTGASFPTGPTTITETPIPAALRPRVTDPNARGVVYFDFAQQGQMSINKDGHIDVMQQTGAARTFMSGSIAFVG